MQILVVRLYVYWVHHIFWNITSCGQYYFSEIFSQFKWKQLCAIISLQELLGEGRIENRFMSEFYYHIYFNYVCFQFCFSVRFSSQIPDFFFFFFQFSEDKMYKISGLEFAVSENFQTTFPGIKDDRKLHIHQYALL